jgi:hypothetical protein
VRERNEVHRFANSNLAQRPPFVESTDGQAGAVMGKVKLILGLAILALAVVAGWQIASSEVTNLELREDLRDIAAQGGPRIGFGEFSTDEDLRNAAIRAAKRYEIQLEPEQVTVRRTGTVRAPIIYLTADYKARVTLLPRWSFTIHFHPTSAK